MVAPMPEALRRLERVGVVGLCCSTFCLLVFVGASVVGVQFINYDAGTTWGVIAIAFSFFTMASLMVFCCTASPAWPANVPICVFCGLVYVVTVAIAAWFVATGDNLAPGFWALVVIMPVASYACIVLAYVVGRTRRDIEVLGGSFTEAPPAYEQIKGGSHA